MSTIDLDAAAREAVTQVQPMLRALGDAQKDCADASEQVEAMQKQLDADKHALEDAVRALDQEADRLEQELSGAAHAATASVSTLVSALGQAVAEGPLDVDAETAAILHARELLTGLQPRVRELADAAEAAGRAVLDEVTEIANGFDEAVETFEKLVVDFASVVNQVRQVVEGTAAELVLLMTETCEQQIVEKLTDWDEKTAAAKGLVSTTMKNVATHVGVVVEHTQGEWTRRLDETMTEAETEVGALVGVLASVAEAVRNKDSELALAGETVETALRQGAEAAAAVETDLQKVRARWAVLTITC